MPKEKYAKYKNTTKKVGILKFCIIKIIFERYFLHQTSTFLEIFCRKVL